MEEYAAASPAYTLFLPEGDITGLGPVSLEPTVASGLWIMLAPLPPGEHTIHLLGQREDGFETEVIYSLTVE